VLGRIEAMRGQPPWSDGFGRPGQAARVARALEGEGGLPRRKPAERKARYQTVLSEADSACLAATAERMGLPRAEVVRRLIRASATLEPALSVTESAEIEGLRRQVRRAGINLSELLKAIRSGRAVRLADSAPVWRELLAAIEEVEGRLSRLSGPYGVRLYQALEAAQRQEEGAS
jgi:hypothetical protein